MGNVAAVNETLANSSIDEIERMALEAEAKGKQGEQDAAATDEQDVSASSGQTEEQKTAGKNESEAQAKDTDKDTDKETNFAKLRTKLEAQERETQRLAEENKRLAARQYVAELPEDHAEKVAAVDAMIAEIGSKFQEGEITFEEMQSQTRAANTDRELLLAASIKAQISKEMQEQREKEAEEQAALSREDAIKLWEEKQAEFISSKPDSVDYDTDEAKRNSLNTYVKALAADPDNDSKPMEWFLTEAHALVNPSSALHHPNRRYLPTVRVKVSRHPLTH